VASPTVDEARARGKSGKGRRGQEGDETRERRSAGKTGLKKGAQSGKFNSFNDEYQHGGKRGKKQKRRLEEKPPITAEMKASKRKVRVFGAITVGTLAAEMSIKASEVIAKLMKLGVMATVNQSIDLDTATLIASDFGYEIEEGITEERGIELFEEAETGGERLPRPPVVTVMGHVDHGKTSILDAIRKTDVALGEAGGITQHIGAYHVRSKAGDVTFIDTPGHAAFTEMRSRGAQITDLVILVVAADDGVKEQTKEAINHAQAAGVEILVAVNKIDKPGADIDRVKRELSDFGLMPEEWGGKTIYCETSAKQRLGIDELMEAIQLVAEMKELRADPKRRAKGRVIEAKLDKGRGAVATVIVEEGTLHNGEYLVVGQHSGKVRAMFDDKGRRLKAAGPSIPVEIQGLSGVPSAGDEFLVVADEKMAKNVSQARAMKAREAELGASSKISLDKLFDRMSEGEVQELRLIIRADVQGTLEAFAKAAQDLSTKDIKVRVLHEGTGTISDSDILLASASDAIALGFNVRPTVKVKELAARENVDVRSYDVIYHALDDIKKAMIGMLEPTFTEDVIGLAEVRDTFNVPKVGTIAGCFVQDGKVVRNARVRVLREGVVVYTGKISSLRRFKDDAKEVLAGYECGIGVENYNDIKIGDNLEAFLMQEVEATLE
jgi:translation initiation factor IF-2